MKYLKNLSLVLICFSLFFNKSYAHAMQAEAPANLHAKAAVLMDADSGRILFEKEGQTLLPMASTTKIMTCILALECGSLTDYAQASAYAASMPKVKLYVKQNECYLLKDLLYSLMLESHNDAAVVIAEHIAGSTKAFADMMNQKARDIGCFDTYFITPNGLDATVTGADGVTRSHATTAVDLARIMSYCITKSPKKDVFLEITGTPSHTFQSFVEKDGVFVPGSRTFSCHNHNAFLSMMDGALSGKTGFTGNAGYCYVGALKQGNKTFVVALLACGWPNNKGYKWSDTKQLMKYGLENYEYHTLEEFAFDADTLKPILVLNGQTHKIGESAYTKAAIKKSQEDVPYDCMDSISGKAVAEGFLLKAGEEIEVSCDIARILTAPIHAGEQIGTVKYILDNKVYRLDSVIATTDIPCIDFVWCFRQIMHKYCC